MKIRLALLLLISLLIVTGACAPKTSPVSIPPSTPAPVAAPKSPSVSNTEDVEWAKTIDAARKEGKATIYSFSFKSKINYG